MPDMLTTPLDYLIQPLQHPYEVSTIILSYEETALERLFHLTDSEAHIILHFIFSDIMLRLRIDGVVQLLQPTSSHDSCHCLVINISARMKTYRMCAKCMEENPRGSRGILIPVKQRVVDMVREEVHQTDLASFLKLELKQPSSAEL